MRTEIDQLLATCHGVAARHELLRVVTANQLDHEIAAGHLVAPFGRAYCRPWDADQPQIRERAALVSIGGSVALSHLTALRRYGLTSPARDTIHVTVGIRRHPIHKLPGLAVHRTRVRTPVRRVGGLATVDPAIALTRSWPLLSGPDQRGPAIEAVRNRLVTADELRVAAARAIGMTGRSSLLRLAELLGSGCESELEIWGFLDVFNAPGLDHGVRQKTFRIAGRSYRTDLAYEEEKVAVELDGERYHSTPEQRERDRVRDAGLATIGWLTLRFSHSRLHRDVTGVRRDTLATLNARRRRGV
jgi:very-short-patch-repair endonuclease